LTDDIHLPHLGDFVGSSSSTPTESYYSTLFHELTHWTSHQTRCARDLGRRFGKVSMITEPGPQFCIQ